MFSFKSLKSLCVAGAVVPGLALASPVLAGPVSMHQVNVAGLVPHCSVGWQSEVVSWQAGPAYKPGGSAGYGCRSLPAACRTGTTVQMDLTLDHDYVCRPGRETGVFRPASYQSTCAQGFTAREATASQKRAGVAYLCQSVMLKCTDAPAGLFIDYPLQVKVVGDRFSYRCLYEQANRGPH